MGLQIQMRIIHKVKYHYEIPLKFDGKFLTSLKTGIHSTVN